jgi:hypothetical protein
MELLKAARSSIDQLFRLSMLIRRHRPRGRIQGTPDFSPFETSPDITYIGDKFPKVKAHPWLAKRLGNAITRRRHFIQYRQLHRARLAKQQAAEDEDDDGKPGTIATSYHEDGKNPQSGVEFRNRRSSAVSVVTSFFTAYGDETGRHIPDFPDMTLDGVQLEYGIEFECPYCRTIQLVSNRLEWKYAIACYSPLRRLMN